jgi:hypothetical protein
LQRRRLIDRRVKKSAPSVEQQAVEQALDAISAVLKPTVATALNAAFSMPRAIRTKRVVGGCLVVIWLSAT